MLGFFEGKKVKANKYIITRIIIIKKRNIFPH